MKWFALDIPTVYLSSISKPIWACADLVNNTGTFLPRFPSMYTVLYCVPTVGIGIHKHIRLLSCMNLSLYLVSLLMIIFTVIFAGQWQFLIALLPLMWSECWPVYGQPFNFGVGAANHPLRIRFLLKLSTHSITSASLSTATLIVAEKAYCRDQ